MTRKSFISKYCQVTADWTVTVQSAVTWQYADCMLAETKEHSPQIVVEAPVLELWVMWSTLSLPLFPGQI